jgi:hypothetical protein
MLPRKRVIVRAMGKYDRLYERLARAAGETVRLIFGQIDELVQGLPPSARNIRLGGPMKRPVATLRPGRGWEPVGRCDEVDLRGEHVAFRRA